MFLIVFFFRFEMYIYFVMFVTVPVYAASVAK